MPSKCRGCGAITEWVKTNTGRAMPVDPEPVMIRITGSKKADTVIISNGGRIYQGKEIARGPQIANSQGNDTYKVGRVAHFATCPQASQFRRGKK